MEINIKMYENLTACKGLIFKVATLTEFEDKFASFLVKNSLIGSPFPCFTQEGLDLFYKNTNTHIGIEDIPNCIKQVKGDYADWYSKLGSLMVIYTVSQFKGSEVAND